MVLLVVGGEATPEANVIPGTPDVAVSFSWKEDDTSTLSSIIASGMSSSEDKATSMTSVLFVAFESDSSAAFIVVNVAVFPTLCVEFVWAKGKISERTLRTLSAGFVSAFCEHYCIYYLLLNFISFRNRGERKKERSASKVGLILVPLKRIVISPFSGSDRVR